MGNQYTEKATEIEKLEITAENLNQIELPEKAKIFLDDKYSYRAVDWTGIDLSPLKEKKELKRIK